MNNARSELAQAVSLYHLADRALHLHCRSWLAVSSSLLPAIERFWAAERVALRPDWIPAHVREEGESALLLCSAAQDRKERLAAVRLERLREVFRALGSYYGAMMARDATGSLAGRFQRHLRDALRERQENADRVKVRLRAVTDVESFEMMITWSRTLGYRSPRDFFVDLRIELDMRSGIAPAALEQAARLGVMPA
ncbi:MULTISPECIES: hypothetical protein [Cupriavidus]|uniref:hypothetical protein n=1 Tax=Cupriavidus TaxID=106589 RepID=UPI0011ED353E|nr:MULTISPECIES: hypothetical protein [Cupriavidus]MWL91801.1 hypothetical protein [Cupriavidus sp. SW-Y-13]